MPIYEFVCHDCGTNFEKRVSFIQTSTPACATCESSNVQRQMSAPAIHFKGSGWYITDSKKGNSTTQTASSSESSKESTNNPAPIAA